MFINAVQRLKYIVNQQMSRQPWPWNALEVCSSEADPRWGAPTFSWQPWHQSWGWENLRMAKAEKKTQKPTKCQSMNTSCVTSCWLIPFHGVVMTALLSASALDGNTFKRANLTSGGGGPQRTSAVLFKTRYGAHKNSLHLPKPVPVVTPCWQQDTW